MLRNGRRALPQAISGRVRGRLRRALDELAVTLERTAMIVAQTRFRLAGQMPGSATRLVTLHDPDARPIRKGRFDKPVEFGYKAQVTDNDDGVILDYGAGYGAAPDARNWRPPSSGSPAGPAAPPARSPPTAATARHPLNATCTSWVCATWRSRARANQVLPGVSSNTGEPSARK